MHKYSALLLSALILTSMAGCSVQPLQPNSTNWDQHQLQLQQLEYWQLMGKMGYQQSGDGGSAWIDWQQQGASFDVRLSGPFGAGTTHIHSDPEITQLQQAGKQPVFATTAAELTQQLFGWQWPMEQLRYWVRGVPAPHSPTENQVFNEAGLLDKLEQAGWQLQFSRYQSTEGWILPGKIRGKLLADNGDTSFTLVIKSWRPNAGLTP